MLVGDLDIWPITVEIGGRREEWQKEEGWNMGEEE